MSDYKYIKFTGLTNGQSQPVRYVPLFNVRNGSFDSSLGYVRFTFVIADINDNQVEITVVGPDGSTPFTAGGAAGYDTDDYVAFANSIFDFWLDALQKGKTVTEVKAGLNGTIRQDLGVITNVAYN